MSDLVICKFRKYVVIHDTECPYWNQVSLNNINPTQLNPNRPQTRHRRKSIIVQPWIRKTMSCVCRLVVCGLLVLRVCLCIVIFTILCPCRMLMLYESAAKPQLIPQDVSVKRKFPQRLSAKAAKTHAYGGTAVSFTNLWQAYGEPQRSFHVILLTIAKC